MTFTELDRYKHCDKVFEAVIRAFNIQDIEGVEHIIKSTKVNTIFLVGSACKNQCINLFEYLTEQYLKYVDDCSDIDIHYNEALIGACHSGNIDLINRIIKLGAECFDDALYNSCFYSNEEVIDLLLEYKISKAGLESCLTPACNTGDENIIKKLYEKLVKS